MINLNTDFINYLYSNPKFQIIFLLLSIWTLVWKGFALWKAAKNEQKKWFIVFLLINTFGILEIIYLFYFSKLKTSKMINMPENNSKTS